jgi:RND family efflux transporter MFP subunit
MPEEKRRVLRRAQVVMLVVLAILVAGGARTLWSRNSNAKVLETGIAENARVYVKVTSPLVGGAANVVSLPGTLQGFVQAPIGARATGYLRRWTHDIGTHVEKGELLAEIDSPELDQQLSQAIAARQQAAASLSLAKSTVERWEALRKKDVVAQQELDEKRSTDAQAKANLAAFDANVERLRELEAFKRVVAPFPGVITRRNVDVGDLIDTNTGRALFVLTQTDPLRVYVNVPQAYAHLVKAGQQVIVTQAEISGRKFQGRVERTSGAIDTATRTMQVEVALPNRDGALLPGAYVQVQLPLAASGDMLLNANAVLFRSEGVRVASVDDAGKVKLLPVRLGRNYGDRIEVLEGLKGNERLVLNPPDTLADGDVVTVAADKTPS